jgi:hypothetical protein
MLKQAFFIFFVCTLFAICGCDGYLNVTGIVTEDGDPVKSATVKVISTKGRPLGSVKTDSTGTYNIAKSTTPMRGHYYVVFEKKGYKTDTTEIRKSRGFCVVACDHSMQRKAGR